MLRALLTVAIFTQLLGCANTPVRYGSTYTSGSSEEMAAETATVKLAEQLPLAAKVPAKLDGPPKFIRFVLPPMPPEAIDRKIEGDVTVRLEIDETGNVVRVSIISSPHPLLSQAVADAAKQWRLAPMTSGGKPSPFAIVQTYGFHAP